MDQYGRLITVVYRDGRNINRWLVRRGHAWEYGRYSEYPMLGWLEWLAWTTNRGLWAGDNPVPPSEWRHGSSYGGQHRTGLELCLLGLLHPARGAAVL